MLTPPVVDAAPRPVIGLDVDGVIALAEPPLVAARDHDVSAWARWRRRIRVPVGAASTVRALAERYEVVWVSAWGHTAHSALRPVLDLPEQPWPFLPVQFAQAAALADWADGRPWLLIHDGVDDAVTPEQERHVLQVDPRRGIGDVSIEDVAAAIEALQAAPR
ncbi:hypothetical protein GCM10027062_18690 [Nocardioides hungaricus]